MPKKSSKSKNTTKIVAEEIKPTHHHRRRWSLIVPAFSFLLLIFTISLAIYLRYFAYTVNQQSGTNSTSLNATDSVSSSSGSSGSAATAEIKTVSSTSPLVVKTGSFVVTVTSVSDSVQKISKVAEDFKGSVVSSYVSDASTNCAYEVMPVATSKSMMYPSYGCYNATITIRVPAASYENARTAIQKVDENARFDSESTQETDVTTQAGDLQTQLTSYQSEQTSLQKLLDAAKTVDDILKIRTELTQVSAQVQSLQQQIRDISKNVQYSELTVSLAKLTSDQVSEPSVSGKFAIAWAAMRQDLNNLGTALIFVVVYLVIYLPVLVILLIAFWLIKRAIHRRKH